MTEQYDVAAWRHLNVGDKLLAGSELDDAGYHYGVSGENALKALLKLSGAAATLGTGRGSPMRGHFPTLAGLINRTQATIALGAVGRFAPSVTSLVLHPTFAARFSGWSIDIRYADTRYTPVAPATVSQWKQDAEDLATGLIV